jgi:hypothetical protein
MNAPLITTLADKAVLVRFVRGTYQPYKFDKGATELVENTNGVAHAGRFNKRLFAECEPLSQTNAAFNAAYVRHMALTLPWLDDGVRMLPSHRYDAYRDALRPLIQEAELAADRLQRDWDQLVVADMTRLGKLANATDYPLNIRDRYYIDIRFLPVPSKGDFRVDIDPEDIASLDRAIMEAERNANQYLLTELLKPLKHAVTKLRLPIGADGSVFRDSLVENLMEMCQRVLDLNINNDHVIHSEAINILSNLKGVPPDTLRESDEVRAGTANRLDDVMARLSAYMGTT